MTRQMISIAGKVTDRRARADQSSRHSRGESSNSVSASNATPSDNIRLLYQYQMLVYAGAKKTLRSEVEARDTTRVRCRRRVTELS